MKIFNPKYVVIVTISLLVTSCGSRKPMVTQVKVSPYEVNGRLGLKVDALLSTGRIRLPSSTLPIRAPRTGRTLGQLILSPAAEQGNQIEIILDVEETLNINPSIGSLPNGASLPLIADNPVVEIPIVGNSRLYLSAGVNNLAIGVAIGLKAFDTIGLRVGNTRLFPAFNRGNVLGAAGVYTSLKKGENGFGLFMDLTNALPAKLGEFSSYGYIDSQLDYSSKIPRDDQEQEINRQLYKLHRKSEKLRLN